MTKHIAHLAACIALLSASAPAWGAGECLPCTEVGGLICVDTTWDLAGSPYCVTQSVLIACDATLTIEAGVEVRFETGMGITVGHVTLGPGCLVARGTEGAEILFTTNDPCHFPPDTADPGDWSRIFFTDDACDAVFDGQGYYSGGILEWVTIEYAGGVGPTVTTDQCSPYISHCEIRHSAHRGIFADCTASPSIHIEYCEIWECTVNGNGGGIYLTGGADHTLTGNNVHDCSASGSGGGIYLTGGANHTLTGNNVHDCSAGSSYNHRGGGIYIDARATVEGNTVSGCTAGLGGGICLWDNSDGSTVSGNEVTGNAATSAYYNAVGGGIHLRNSGSCTLTGNTVTGNWTTHLWGLGGGISLSGSDGCTLAQNIVRGNSTSGGNAQGGGIHLDYSTSCLLRDNTVTGNSTSGQYAHGGGIYLNNSSSTAVVSNTITGNLTSGVNADGGAISFNYSGSCTVESNTITNNTCGDEGGGIMLWNSGNFTMTDTVVQCNHTIAGTTGGIWVGGPSKNVTFAGDEVKGIYNTIAGNDGYCVWNNNPYDPSGNNDIDATYVNWCTEDPDPIQACIWDYFDDAGLAFVIWNPPAPPGPECCPSECCPWDLDCDDSVGILDLLALLAAWGTDPGGPPDFDGDGTVGILDLLALLANWGDCP